MKRPVETKVIAATAGSAVSGSTVGTFVVWLMGVTFWHASTDADKATAAIAAVPIPVVALVLLIVGSVGAGVAGYLAPHTPVIAIPVQPDVKP